MACSTTHSSKTIMIYASLFEQSSDHDSELYWNNEQCWLLSDLQREVNWIMHQLQQQSLAIKDERWVIMIDERFPFTATFFALLFLGGIPLLLGHRKMALMEEQAPLFKGVITYQEDQELNVPHLNLMPAPDDFIAIETVNHSRLSLNEQMVTLLTSGSTSTPKIIQKSVDLLAKESEILAREWGSLLQNCSIISTVSPMHQYGLTFNILLPLILRRPVFNDPIQFQESLYAELRENNLLISSPAFLKRLDDQLSIKSGVTIDMILSAGGPLDYEDAKNSESILGVLPTEIYGSSETGVIAHRQQVDKISPFLPFLGVKFGQYKDGSIKIDSPIMINDPSIRLNDSIAFEGVGFLLKGRLDKVVKIEEKRISLTEIEARLMTQELIKQAVIIPMWQGRRKILGAILLLKAPLEINEREFFQTLRQELSHYIDAIALPRRWVIVDELPYNSQGKLSRHDLQELFQ